MNQFYENGYSSKHEHRSHSNRRLFKKVSQVALVLGLLCVALSVIIFASSFLTRPGTQRKMRVLSLTYVGAGLGLIIVRLIGETIREKASNRRGREKSRNGTSYYYPRNHVGGGPEPRAPGPAPGPRDGMALILVLILLALIAGLVLEIQINARTTLRREQRALLDVRLQQAAADAARAALQRLADDEDLLTDYTNEPWASTEDVTDPSGIATRVVTMDENRFFDLNNLALPASTSGARPASEIVMDLFTLCGDLAPVDRVGALTDWVDGDDEGLAESRYYRELAPPYRPANRLLLSWNELPWVRGFTREYFARHTRSGLDEVFNADLVDCATIVPVERSLQPTTVNVNTAGKNALLGVLGMSREDLARAVLALRAEQPIRNLESLFAVADPALVQAVRPYLDVKSSVFSVNAQAYSEGQSARLRVLARRNPQGNVEVLQWVF